MLFEVSTAKVNAEVPSPVAGTVLEILSKEGDTVPVGAVVALIQLEGEEETEVSEEPAASGKPVSEPTKMEHTIPSVQTVSTEKKPVELAATKPSASSAKKDARWYSPLVLEMAKDAKIATEELDKVPGTGHLGRFTKDDFLTYIEQKKKSTTTAAAAPVAAPAREKEQVPAAPSATTSLHDDSIEIKEMDAGLHRDGCAAARPRGRRRRRRSRSRRAGWDGWRTARGAPVAAHGPCRPGRRPERSLAWRDQPLAGSRDRRSISSRNWSRSWKCR